MACKVKIHDEVQETRPSGWVICFQRCTYIHDDRDPEQGFRFIWRRPDGSLQAARGQARIPDAATLQRLTQAASRAGWL